MKLRKRKILKILKNLKFEKTLPYLVLITVIGLGIAYSAFSSTMNISGIVANVRVKQDTRITGVRKANNSGYNLDSNMSSFKVYGNSEQIYLPEEYQEVEYIQSSGTQWIDTGVYSSNTTGVEVTAEILTNSDSLLFGTYNYMSIGSNNYGLYYSWYQRNWTGTTYRPNVQNKKFTAQINYNNSRQATYDGVANANYIVNYATISKPAAYTAILFGWRRTTTGGVYYLTQAKVYNLKITDGTSLIRDLIPCYRKSDNEIGMYDIINNVFYSNQGTGTFTKGADILFHNSNEISQNRPLRIKSVGDLVTDINDPNYGKYKVSIKFSGKNLLDLYGRSKGTLTGSASSTKREFEFDKYYVGFSNNNYYLPDYIYAYNLTERDWQVRARGAAGIGFPVEVKPSTIYMLKSEKSGWLRVGYFDKSGNYISSADVGNIVSAKTITTPVNCYIVVLVLSVNSTGNLNTYKNIQMEEGTVATTYESYVEPDVYNIYLDEPLRKVGNYEDYIDILNGKVVRNVEVIDSSGTQTLENSLRGLATPVEENVTIPDMIIRAGTSRVSTNTELDPSKIELNGATITTQPVPLTSISSNLNGAGTYLEYNKNSVIGTINLPDSDSEILLEIDVTNFGNAAAGIYSITGLPNNLKYEISNYNLKDKICNSNNECTLGATKKLYMTISYKDGSYDSNNTTFDIKLDFDFKQFYSITYTNILGEYQSEILGGETLVVDFNKYIPQSLQIKSNDIVTNNYTYSNDTLTVTNVNGNIEVIGPKTLKYLIDSYSGHVKYDTKINGETVNKVYGTKDERIGLKNYVVYSGQIWNVLETNDTNHTIKLVSMAPMTSITYGSNNVFSTSWAKHWLDNVFYPILEHTEIIHNSEFCIDNIDVTPDNYTKMDTCTNKVTAKVGLMTYEDYVYAYDGKAASINNSYMYRHYTYLMTPTTTASNQVWHTSNNSMSISDSYTTTYRGMSINPVINIDDNVEVKSGAGTMDNPYVLSIERSINTNEKLNTAKVGDYVYVDEGNNPYTSTISEVWYSGTITKSTPTSKVRYRIVNINSDGTIKLQRMDVLRNLPSSFSANNYAVPWYSNDTGDSSTSCFSDSAGKYSVVGKSYLNNCNSAFDINTGSADFEMDTGESLAYYLNNADNSFYNWFSDKTKSMIVPTELERIAFRTAIPYYNLDNNPNASYPNRTNDGIVTANVILPNYADIYSGIYNSNYWLMNRWVGSGGHIGSIASGLSGPQDLPQKTGIRPVITLSKYVYVKSGYGTISNPYSLDIATLDTATSTTGTLALNKPVFPEIPDFKVYGNSVQDGTPSVGNPVEIESVGNTNLVTFDDWSKSVNGMDLTINDNEFTITGTASTTTLINKSGVLSNGFYQTTLSPGTYTISIQGTGSVTYNGGFPGSFLQGYKITNGVTDGALFAQMRLNTSQTFTLTETKQIVFRLYADTNYVFDTSFKIQLQKGEDVTDYIPQGKYQIPIRVKGKNLLDIPITGMDDGAMKIYKSFDSFKLKGTATKTSLLYRNSTYGIKDIDLDPGTYTISVQGSGTLSDSSITFIQFGKVINNNYNSMVQLGLNKSHTFTLTETTKMRVRVIYYEGVTYDIDFNIQLEKGNEMTAYEPPYTDYNILLDEPLRKVGDYADYIDLVNKKVVRNVEVIDSTGELSIENSLRGLATPAETSISLSDITLHTYTTQIRVPTFITPSNLYLKYYR